MSDMAPESTTLKIEVDLADATIRDSADANVVDESYFLNGLGPVLHAFPQLTVASYWELTVAEHASLMFWIDETENG